MWSTSLSSRSARRTQSGTGLIDLAIGACLSLMLLGIGTADAKPTCTRNKDCNKVGNCGLQAQGGYYNVFPWRQTQCTPAVGGKVGVCVNLAGGKCYSGGCKGTGANGWTSCYMNIGCH